jgi:glycosyltransferase involved in cell wall biosynthesis
LFVCVSAAVRDKLIQRGAPAHKLEVIHIGSDTILDAPVPRQPQQFLFAGRFVEKKGIFVLIEAIRRLRATGNATPIILAGDGPLLAEVKSRSADLTDIEFTGWLDATLMRTTMTQSLALVVPSITGPDGDQEGLPSVAVEAMGLGVPVIASDCTGLQGILDPAHAGLIVPAGDAHSLALAMDQVCADPMGTAMMGMAAHRLAGSEFSAPRQSRRLEDRLITFM